MKNLRQDYYYNSFSHIYVEAGVKDHPRTKAILAKFPKADIIEIAHYKDVFCRRKQDAALQHKSQKLILAGKQGNLLYSGAPVCQNFGNEHFYYTSCIMNCIYDCGYCYLKGMYPSGNLVIFVNIEDIFAETKRRLKEHPLYLCVSYDSDLYALEHLTGYVAAWSDFAAKHQGLTIEVRTKCANRSLLEKITPIERVIFAFTLSPEQVAAQYEHGTPSLKQRILCAKEAIERGFAVRLCFDPMLYVTGWRVQYEEMLTQVMEEIPMKKLVDVSVGSFRISQEYLKKMRKNAPGEAVVWFPYENEDGYYRYPTALLEEMEQFLVERLESVIGKKKIFRWNSQQGEGQNR